MNPTIAIFHHFLHNRISVKGKRFIGTHTNIPDEGDIMRSTIFREYDIRGVVGEDFDFEDVEKIGLGYGAYLQNHGGKRAVIGRDCRKSSPEVRDALIKGLCRSGLHVIDVGVCPTPVLYFALRHLDAEGGVMITASHNPPQYNGFKVCLGKGDDIRRGNPKVSCAYRKRRFYIRERFH